MRIVVLAGGEGRRIGGHKPLRLLGGETLLDRALRRAWGWSDDVLVATAETDMPGIEGPLGGVAAALAGGGDVLTIPCDMPFLPDDLPERLQSKETATIAMSGGRLHPVCALWRARAIEGLAGYVATGRRSLRGFAEAVGYKAVVWDADPVDPFFNINDEADLAQAEALLRSR
ncbi:MAG: molybdenum cofactor guanylyltransferase [Sphingomonadales bacterium]|jgi:molybdopterin-guanine dinucleotide biosynthesis protein A|nr:molybdenum cofactor guanylyltransferase [Sphingomonadales bacterium]MEA3044134.1 molybdenum cofactor guanylyltransferase [Sphingomonadales bacterium]MEA3047427.1 molybdenum cofactor guanylyltransferase [Sphingomonadales bacterium]